MIDNIITAVYLGIVLLIGVLAGKKVKNLEDFSVAGRGFSHMVIFATLSASFIGGGFSIGNAEKVFLFGIVNIFALWGFSLKEVLVAQYIAPRIKKFDNPISVGDIMEYHYGTVSKVITGIFSVILCAGILGAQVGTIGYIFNVFLGLNKLYGILIGCGVVIVYSTIGGMRAVVLTDVLQFIVLSVGIPVVLVFGLIKAGGVSSVVNAVPAQHLTFLGPKTLIAFLSLFLTFVVGETLVPPYMQRLFLSKDVNEVKMGTLLSGIWSVPFFFITGAIGLVALVLFPDIDANLALPIMIKETLPVVLRGIVIAGVISIGMSSADSFLNSAAVSFVRDIMQPIFTREKIKEFRAARLITIVVGVLAVVFAIKIKSILDILIYSYNFWSPILLIPLVMAILGMNVRKRDFYFGMSGGILGVFIWNFIFHSPFGVDGLLIGVAINGLLFTVSRLIPETAS